MGAFLLPSQALRASFPTGGAKCTPVNREILCGKINVSAALPYHKLCRDRRRYTCLPLRGRCPSALRWDGEGSAKQKCRKA